MYILSHQEKELLNIITSFNYLCASPIKLQEDDYCKHYSFYGVQLNYDLYLIHNKGETLAILSYSRPSNAETGTLFTRSNLLINRVLKTINIEVDDGEVI